MGHVSLKLNGSPVSGAVAVVTGAAVVAGFGGYNARGITDSKGIVDFPDPTVWGYPQGSVADVDVTYTDSKGRKYAATGSWEVVSDWNAATGFEGWSPEPLSLNLVPTSEIDSSVLAQIQKNKEGQLKSDNPTANALNDLIWVGVVIVALYLFISLILPQLHGSKGGRSV